MHQLDSWQLLSMQSKIILFWFFFLVFAIGHDIDQMTFPKRVDRRRGISKGYISLCSKRALAVAINEQALKKLIIYSEACYMY